MADDYTPKLGTMRPFEEIHPPGGETVVHIDDVVKIPGSDTEWVVTDVFGDFARLARPDNPKKVFAHRLGQLEVQRRHE